MQITYSAYKNKFECRNGICKWTSIDEDYAISFVFKGDFQYCVKSPDGTVMEDGRGPPAYDDEGKRDAENDETYFVGLDEGSVYCPGLSSFGPPFP